MKRSEQIQALKNKEKIWDVVVIGGGASGLGVALDAVSRGLNTCLIEKYDFGKGTSSRSTKLVHGGVRYLQQGNIKLVREALKERAYMLQKANHLCKTLPFIIPFYSWWQGLYYYIGLKLYDWMSGSKNIGHTKWLNKKKAEKKLPNLVSKNLKGGIQYFDGQFDDARLCIDLVRTIISEEGTCVNYCELQSINKKDGVIRSIVAYDSVNHQQIEIKAKSFVNATGVFTNDIVKIDSSDNQALIVPSRGSHILLNESFLDSNHAIMIPKTPDGRVLFLIPWKNRVLIGTTDIKTEKSKIVPEVSSEEVKYIIETVKPYLKKTPTDRDIISVFAGLRPLAAPKSQGSKTKEISRGHRIIFSTSGLCSIIGGKWTTFRKMGEDVIDQLIDKGQINAGKSRSVNINIKVGDAFYYDHHKNIDRLLQKEELEELIKNEMVVKAEDLLARRLRIIFTDPSFALELSKDISQLIGKLFNKDEDQVLEETQELEKLINNYYLPTT